MWWGWGVKEEQIQSSRSAWGQVKIQEPWVSSGQVAVAGLLVLSAPVLCTDQFLLKAPFSLLPNKLEASCPLRLTL